MYNPDLVPLTQDIRECRNCHSDDGDDLIAPCHCSGSIKYVHRSCLNAWRAYSPNESSFTHCDVCHFEYRFKERPDLRASRIGRFVMYVARDFIGAMIIVQGIIALLATICWAADKSSGTLLRVFPTTWNTLAVYYVWGLFFFSLCAAIYGFILGIYWCCADTSRTRKSQSVTYDTYPYFWGYYYWWWYPYPGTYGGCCPCDCYCAGGHGHTGCCTCACPSCGDCGGHCESKDNNAMGLLAIVVLVVGIVIGVIVCTVIAALIIRNHMKILRRKQDAREMEIVDLEHEGGHGSAAMV